MRVGIDARLTAYRVGGIATYTRELVGALEHLLLPDAVTVVEHRKAAKPVSSYFGTITAWTPPHHRAERWTLGLELLRGRFDIFHSTDFIPPHSGARRRVITVHDLTFLHYPETLTSDSRRYYNDQIYQAVQVADHILTVSHAARDDIINQLNVEPCRITTAPNGVSPRFRPLPAATVQARLRSLNLPAVYFLHVGTWEPRKNIIGLVRAYALLREQQSDVPPLLLVGQPGWHYNALRAEIAMFTRVEPHLIWRDDISDDDLPIIYNGAVSSITPSWYEGFGLPTLEAMACGIVPLVSDCSALPELVEDVGLRFQPDDSTALAAAMQRVLSDSVWRTQQTLLAIDQARPYTWQRCAEITLAVYQSL